MDSLLKKLQDKKQELKDLNSGYTMISGGYDNHDVLYITYEPNGFLEWNINGEYEVPQVLETPLFWKLLHQLIVRARKLNSL